MFKFLAGRNRMAVLAAFAISIGLVFVLGASADSLGTSKFEIDNPTGSTTGANLKLDTAGNLDWSNVAETRQADLPTGGSDDSYAGGEKEDDVCPQTGTGSIPNNKSDLLAFGGYKESVAGGPGYLHVFWSRVNAPTGTTNMDFEFNKSTTDCDGAGSSKNVTRTAGDILLQFDVDNGGKVATLSKRIWSGTAWGTAVPLGGGDAIGSINQVNIPFGDSDGLISAGNLTARTFGEATFNLASVFNPDVCESFGSAMLKSRSSDQFNSALKDFIAPIAVNISNCASVVIRKETDPNGATQSFGFTKNFASVPASANTFSLTDGGSQSYTTTLGNGKSVSEDAVTAAGWTFDKIDCAVAGHASSGVTPVISGQTVTFDLDSASDVVDCTFFNKQQLGAIKITKRSVKQVNGVGVPLAGAVFTIGGGIGDKTTDSNGVICVDGLAFATYSVVEKTAPSGYAIDDPASYNIVVDNNASCADSPFVGETKTFTDTPLTDILVKAQSQATGGTASSVSCVEQGVTPVKHIGNSPQPATGFADPAQVDANGANGVKPGTYVCTIVVDP